jgi:protocatechuate 3,4-dioxygenase beta subunit
MLNSMYLKTVAVVVMLCGISLAVSYDFSGPDSLTFGSTHTRIVDSAGKPVAGATVEFGKELTIDGYVKKTHEKWPLRFGPIVTDSQGRCPLPRPDPNESLQGKSVGYEANVKAEGFLPRNQVSLGHNHEAGINTIELLRPGSADGMLLGPDGKPLGDAPITVETQSSYKSPRSMCRGCYRSSATTDENGYFKLENLPPGPQLIIYNGRFDNCTVPKAEVSDYYTCQIAAVSESKTTTGIVLDLSKSTASLAGKVLDLKGKPIEGALVHLSKELKTADGSSTGHIASSVPTDTNGVYSINHLPAGEFMVHAEYPYIKGSCRQPNGGRWVKVLLDKNTAIMQQLELERQDIHGSR